VAVPSRIPKASGLTIAGEMKRRKKKFFSTQETQKWMRNLFDLEKKKKVVVTCGGHVR
jgi:3-mercaptopyruvate sulfurtransferase SseA